MVKFFPRDAIGRKPKKVGDTFKAKWFGGVQTFRVVEYFDSWFMCEPV